MLSKKLRQLVAKRDRRRSRQTRNRLTGIEGLENRVVMTAGPLGAIVGAGDAAGPVEEVMTLSSPEVTARIVNGTPTSSFASVGLVGDTSGSFCSGTLISPSHVLTAGHCAVGVGDTQGRFIVGGQTYSTNDVLVHPQYNDNTLNNDIAIYSLSSSVSNVTPSPINRITPVVGQTLTMVGFGAGGTGTSGHNGDFGTKRVGTTPIDNVTSTLITWSFDNNSESNTAPGDSGGPAFLESGGVFYVAGVTSGGDNADAGIGDNSFDTRVDAYASWIDSIVGQQPNPNPDPDPNPNPDPNPDPDPNPNPTPDPDPSGDDHVDQPGNDATLITLDGAGRALATGSLEEIGDRDVFQVVVNDAGMATFTATGTTDLDTYLRVYDGDGNLVAQNDDFGGTLNSQTTLDVDPGVYYASVGSYADSEAGRYELQVQVVVRDDTNPLPDADTLTLNSSGRGRADGEIASGNQSDLYTFTATVTGRMTIRGRALSGNLDTMITVYDADGNEVAFNDDYRGRTDSRVRLEVNAGETYSVELSSWGNTTGDYRLNIATRAARQASPDLVDVDTFSWNGDPYDVNDDGRNSPLDVLQILNYLNAPSGQRSAESTEGGVTSDRFDVNGDGSVTPLDALMVINRLNSPTIGDTVARMGSTKPDVQPHLESVTSPCEEPNKAEPAIAITEGTNRSSNCNHDDEWGDSWFGEDDPFAEDNDWLL